MLAVTRASGAIGSSRERTGPLIQPMDTPLVFSGFSPQTLELWKEHAPAGLIPVEGMGGSESKEKQPDPLVPGSAVSAVLVRGDLDIAATCTVTYVDPKKMLACGHPITQFGPVSMPMTKADVVATLALAAGSLQDHQHDGDGGLDHRRSRVGDHGRVRQTGAHDPRDAAGDARRSGTGAG